MRPANNPIQIASQNALIFPQIFAYSAHAGINRLPLTNTFFKNKQERDSKYTVTFRDTGKL